MRMRVSAINLFALLLFGDLRDDLLGNLFKVRWLHGVGRAALRHGTDVVDVAEHFRERHFGEHVRRLVLAFRVHDLAAAAAQVADDVALELVRGGDFDLHDRFEEDRAGLFHRVLHGEDGGELERQFVGIDFVIGTVGDVDGDVDDGRTVDHAVEQRFFDALFTGGNVFLRDIAADDLVLDLDALAPFLRLHLDDDVAVLTAAARLLDEFAFALGGLGD